MSGEKDWAQLLKWDQPLEGEKPGENARTDDVDDTAAAAVAEFPPAVLVVGACGGAGSTTTALGIANSAALAGASSVAIDATVGGGDLVDRGASRAPGLHSVEGLLEIRLPSGDLRDDVFDACASTTSAGARILHQSGDREPYVDLRPLDPYLRARRYVAIYDAGRLWRPAHVRPLQWLDEHTPIVLTVPSRADAFNRMRYSLDCLADFGGVDRLRHTIVVVTNQRPGVRPDDVDALRKYLSGRAADVLAVPYDEELAVGAVVDHSRLRQATTAAYDQICAALAALPVG
ncbi:MAG: hypothetical protein ICV72_00935 [Aldersonia sp.]|nr:hypothetical protein [Aldersonia sp.]